MKVIAIDEYGDVNQLHEEELPKPEILDDEVLVKVLATSVNPVDWKAREGFLKALYPWSFPVVLGWDLAGIIIQVGKNVSDFQVGDEIFARPDTSLDGKKGTYAEYIAVKSDKLALKPKKLTFEEAAAVPLAGLTAWQVLVDRLKVKKNDKVLIQAGAGGVGIFAIQIAKYLGAYVATTASEKNKEMLLNLGADEVIDYHKYDIQSVLSSYDAVLDTVNQIDEGLSILKSDGKLVTISANPTNEQMSGQPSAESWFLQPNGEQLKELAKLIEADKLKIVIDSRYPLTEAGVKQAHIRSESHRAVGKIVIFNEDK